MHIANLLVSINESYGGPPKAAIGLGNEVQQLDMTEEDRAAMGERGRELVTKEYAWEVLARKMLTVYYHIFEGKENPLHPQPINAS